MNVSFVILHYSTIEDTIQCVQSIDALENNNCDSVDMIIVDNHSCNGSGADLKKRYEGRRNIHVLLLEENLGFANGNNYGYQYAKAKCNPDYVIVSNNDVFFPQRDFLQKLSKVHSETLFDLCGPDIVVPSSGLHQNPVSLKPYRREDVIQTITLFEQKLEREERRGIDIKIKQFAKSVLGMKPAVRLFALFRNRVTSRNWMKQCLDNPIIHGACVICSSNFIAREETLFWPGTFMYFEEPILNYLCNIRGYRMAYCPQLTVLHNEDSSTNYAYSSRLEKNRFKYQNGIKSGRAFLELIDQLDEAAVS